VILDLTAAEVDRFHSKIARGSGCWEWTGQLNNQGYGRFAITRDGRTKRILAHRLSYFLATHCDPTGQVIRHTCDNPLCARPSHLIPGSQRDNILDAKERGRMNVTGLHEWHQERAARALARIEAGEKACKTCRVVKPLDGGFRLEPRNADGRDGTCRDCLVARERAGRAS
jgi:hypothetical protein